MTSAFLLINCLIGFQNHIVNELKRLSEFVDIYRVDSTYDIIAKVNVNSEEELQEITISKIRKIPGIKSTLTLVIVKHSSKTNSIENG
ncbi:MAG TPA: Lrp/AsnC family transcriptional regulator [Nitrososphaeraceae archaeon]|jgi:DNA-binding Lrp family transcriptional regulator